MEWYSERNATVHVVTMRIQMRHCVCQMSFCYPYSMRMEKKPFKILPHVEIHSKTSSSSNRQNFFKRVPDSRRNDLYNSMNADQTMSIINQNAVVI